MFRMCYDRSRTVYSGHFSVRLKQVLDQCHRREGNAVSKEKNLMMRKWSMEATAAYCAMEVLDRVHRWIMARSNGDEYP